MNKQNLSTEDIIDQLHPWATDTMKDWLKSYEYFLCNAGKYPPYEHYDIVSVQEPDE